MGEAEGRGSHRHADEGNAAAGSTAAHMEVSIAMGVPYLWMVYKGESHLEMDENWG